MQETAAGKINFEVLSEFTRAATCNVVCGSTFLSGHRLKGEKKKCLSSDAKMCLGKQSGHAVLCAERLTVQA